MESATPLTSLQEQTPRRSDELTWLQKQTEKRSDEFARIGDDNKNKAWILKTSSIVLSAAIPVLLGFTVDSESTRTLLKNIALVMGVFVTLLNTYDAFFDHRALWINEKLTLRRLNGLKSDLEFYALSHPPKEIKDDELRTFKNRFDRILQDHSREWQRIRTEKVDSDTEDEPEGD
jgi:hypothetical protein